MNVPLPAGNSKRASPALRYRKKAGKGREKRVIRLLSTLRAGYCRLGASFWLLPAGSGTFMSTDYSCGLFGMHNVEGQNTQALPGYLDLSNTWFPRKTLSLSKPPRLFYQKVTF